MIMGVLIMTNAQIEKKELKVTPEIEEALLEPIHWLIDRADKGIFSSELGIKNRSQLEKLHFGKAIPIYEIGNEHVVVGSGSIPDYKNRDEELRFTGNWLVPVLSDGEPLFFEIIASYDLEKYSFLDFRPANIAGRIPYYEHKDLIIGYLEKYSSKRKEFLIIQKENQDIFVEMYDETTQEYFKNEYSFSELVNYFIELRLREKEARSRYYDKIANKSELKLTPEITEMLYSSVFSRMKNWSDLELSHFNIKNRSQLTNLELGKPIPMYIIDNESLKFIGKWQVAIMADGEPIFLATVAIAGDGQYSYAGGGSADMVKCINDYGYKDLIIGFLGVKSASGRDYIYIKKENTDIFVEVYDWGTRELFKNEYSLSELINLIKEK